MVMRRTYLAVASGPRWSVTPPAFAARLFPADRPRLFRHVAQRLPVAGSGRTFSGPVARSRAWSPLLHVSRAIRRFPTEPILPLHAERANQWLPAPAADDSLFHGANCTFRGSTPGTNRWIARLACRGETCGAESRGFGLRFLVCGRGGPGGTEPGEPSPGTRAGGASSVARAAPHDAMNRKRPRRIAPA